MSQEPSLQQPEPSTHPIGEAGFPAPPGHPHQPPQRRGYNGYALAALALALAGGFALGVILAIVALRDIRRTGQPGRRMAIAAFYVSGVWAVGLCVAIAISIANEADRDSAGNVTGEGTVSATALRPGDCVRELKEGPVYDLPAVPCAQTHQAEIFAVFTLPAGDWPGDDAASKQAAAGCQDRLAGYSTRAAADDTLEVTYLYPSTAAAWRQDRGVTCIVFDPHGGLTESLRN